MFKFLLVPRLRFGVILVPQAPSGLLRKESNQGVNPGLLSWPFGSYDRCLNIYAARLLPETAAVIDCRENVILIAFGKTVFT